METTNRRPTRRMQRQMALSATLAVICSIAFTTTSFAADRFWNAGNGNWDNPANWFPIGVPGSDDEIHIGNLPGVQNSTVMLIPPGTGYDLLEITDGMTLDMNGGELVSFDLASITGLNSRLIVRPAPGGLNSHPFIGTLELGTGAYFELRDNAGARIHGDSESHGTISGRGEFLIASTTPFENAGVIRPGNNGGLVVQQGTYGDQWIDLDGFWGTGHLLLDTPFAELEVNAEALMDWYSGSITMAPGALLTMNINQNWRTDPGCVLNVGGTGNPAAASQIAGSALFFDGTMNVSGDQGHLRILVPIEFHHQQATVQIGDTDWLELDGVTTIHGGDYTVGNGGILDFDAQTTVLGGTFNTVSTNPANGSVDFNALTYWNGDCDINGVARQFGNAWVTAPAVVNAGTFDMDGNGTTSWTIWNDLEIHADAIQSDGTNEFHGTITVANGSLGRLAVHLPASNPLFKMDGEMNLIGHPGFFSTRYAGSPLDLIGDLNVSGLVAMGGYLRAFDGAIDIGTNAVLRLDAGGLITTNCLFGGDGELRIGAGSSPLFTNAMLNGVGLKNQGSFRFQSELSVDRFENEAGANWQVSLGGYDPGVDHDHLFVTGGDAVLAGSLEVGLEIIGDSPFMPEIGDEFVILTATGNAVGSFDDVSTSCAEGNVFHWNVLYGAHDVRLSVDAITGMPGDMNCDCTVNGLDIQPFMTAMMNAPAYEAAYPDCYLDNADVNGDGGIDFDDVAPFVQLLVENP